MGVGYYRPVSQWSKGQYRKANNSENDLAKINASGARFRADDHGNTTGSATAVSPRQGQGRDREVGGPGRLPVPGPRRRVHRRCDTCPARTEPRHQVADPQRAWPPGGDRQPLRRPDQRPAGARAERADRAPPAVRALLRADPGHWRTAAPPAPATAGTARWASTRSRSGADRGRRRGRYQPVDAKIARTIGPGLCIASASAMAGVISELTLPGPYVPSFRCE